MALTNSQRAAVLYEQNLIVFAGPGSGKTSTIIAKACQILTAPESRLCLATFTAAAAREMRTRLDMAFKKRNLRLPESRVTIGTFHAIARSHLLTHKLMKKPLAEPVQLQHIQHRLMRGLDKDGAEAARKALETYQTALDRNAALNDLKPEHRAIVVGYEEALDAANITDFSNMLRDCVVGMRDGIIPLLNITDLIGDEMQDADTVQLLFMLLHCKKGATTTLIADDDQTIYRWRNALGYEGLQRFAADANAVTIVLGENFRSNVEIVEASQKLIAHNNPQRIDKSPRAHKGTGGVLEEWQAATAEDECKYVAEAIAANRAAGLDMNCAILSRTNGVLMTMEAAMRVNEIPYIRVGPSFWDKPEVVLFLDLLAITALNSTRALTRLLTWLPVNQAAATSLIMQLKTDARPFLNGQLPMPQTDSEIGQSALARIVRLYSEWSNLLEQGDLSKLIFEAQDEAGAMVERFNDREEISEKKTRTARKLIAGAAAAVGKFRGPISARLEAVRREPDPKDNPVKLMTMHGSKGLEFDSVYLIDANMNEESAPLAQARVQRQIVERSDTPDERRLFYVALTRAERSFTVTHGAKPVSYISEAGIIGPHRRFTESSDD